MATKMVFRLFEMIIGYFPHIWPYKSTSANGTFRSPYVTFQNGKIVQKLGWKSFSCSASAAAWSPTNSVGVCEQSAAKWAAAGEAIWY